MSPALEAKLLQKVKTKQKRLGASPNADEGELGSLRKRGLFWLSSSSSPSSSLARSLACFDVVLVSPSFSPFLSPPTENHENSVKKTKNSILGRARRASPPSSSWPSPPPQPRRRRRRCLLLLSSRFRRHLRRRSHRSSCAPRPPPQRLSLCPLLRSFALPAAAILAEAEATMAGVPVSLRPKASKA